MHEHYEGFTQAAVEVGRLVVAHPKRVADPADMRRLRDTLQMRAAPLAEALAGERRVPYCPALRFNPWLTLADTIGELLRHHSDAPLVPVRELDDLPTRTEAPRLVRARNHWHEIKDEPITVREDGGLGYRMLLDGNHRLTVARERGDPIRVIFVTNQTV